MAVPKFRSRQKGYRPPKFNFADFRRVDWVAAHQYAAQFEASVRQDVEGCFNGLSRWHANVAFAKYVPGIEISLRRKPNGADAFITEKDLKEAEPLLKQIVDALACENMRLIRLLPAPQDSAWRGLPKLETLIFRVSINDYNAFLPENRQTRS